MTHALFGLLVVLAAFPAHAQRFKATSQVTLYASPKGDDANNCTAGAQCKTMQRAYQVAKSDYDFAGNPVLIKLSAGTFDQGVQMSGALVGMHVIMVQGEGKKTCIRPKPGTAAFDIQDGAMASIMDLRIDGKGIVGFFGRQFAIVDIARVTFGEMPEGTAVAMTDQAGANVTESITLAGSMTTLFSANGYSRIRLGNDLVIGAAKPITVNYLHIAAERSLISYTNAARYENPGFISGLSYVVAWDGTIVLNGTQIPGTPGATEMGGNVYP